MRQVIAILNQKGGVGKTTVAAASALRSAELGYKTLVASTDIQPLGDEVQYRFRIVDEKGRHGRPFFRSGSRRRGREDLLA